MAPRPLNHGFELGAGPYLTRDNCVPHLPPVVFGLKLLHPILLSHTQLVVLLLQSAFFLCQILLLSSDSTVDLGLIMSFSGQRVLWKTNLCHR